MDTPDAGPWSAPEAPLAAEPDIAHPREGDERPGLTGTVRRGAKAGFRFTSYVAGPIAVVMALAGVVLTVLAGRGFEVHLSMLNAMGFYLGSVLWGVIIGAAVGLVLGLMPARAGSLPVSDRPIRLRFWRTREADLPVRRRRRRWPWVLGGLAWVVFVTACGIGVYLRNAVDRRLADAVSAADRDDPNWRIDDLMAHREPVPDEENSALVVGEVVSLLPENWPRPPAPAPGGPAPKATEVQIAYDRMFESPENLRLDAATADALRRELAGSGEAVRLGRTVANYARGRHELVLGPTLIDTLLPETQQARTAARLLAADAAVRAHDGDLDGAIDSGRAVLGVGRSIGDEPFLVSHLVRAAIGALGLTSVRRVLGQGEPSDAALARLQALLIDEMNAPLLLYGLRGERATLTEVIRRIGSGELPISALSGQGARSAGDARGAIAPWGRLLFDNQRAVGLEWMNEAVAIARRPPAEQPPAWKVWEDGFQRVRHDRIGVLTAALPLLMMPAITASCSAQARYQAELGATALLLAAERHRRKTGAWPASAGAIDPEIVNASPVDPFSGRPFVFDRRDGRLIVHSVGPNLKDEHGAYEPRRWNNGGPDDVGATAWDVALRRQAPP